MSDKSVEFSVLCSMLEAIARSKKAAVKRKHIRTFLDHVYTDRQYFSALRLLLPSLDRERASYGLKEAVLAKCVADALGLAKDSEDAQRLLNWRKGGARVGANAGNFPLIAAEILYRRQSVSSGDLKIKDMNDFLDKLATSESREEKTSVIAELIKNTNAQEMKWIVRIVLKDLKLGIHEKAIFHEFHPDAEDLFNVTCDLKLVCEKLKDRTERFNRQDVEVGKAIRPQLALRVADVDTAWKKLRGKQMAVECKFDGDRIQVHKDGSDVHFFSRNFIDHLEYSDAMANVFIQHVRIDKCILDGEMLVWDRLNNRFTEFGSNQSLAKAAKDGLETDQQLCYVAFDILYAGDGSVIHQSLRERREYLSKVVQPVKGQLELLHQHDDDPRWSIIASSAKDVEKFFLETVENRDEGIVIKDLDSKWEPGDRSGKWLKLKPDYINAGSDLDALIIGGYFGSGRRGGEVAQFLLGLAERPTPGAHPTRFVSFCKVGSGLTEDERSALVSKLKPYFRRYETNAKAPSFYTVTNSSKERPDVWIEQPEKSVILEITSDIRTIKSEVFAAPYSLRFPRASRVRYDKPWYDCLDVKSLIEIVHSRSVSATSANLYGSEKASKETKKGLRKRTKILPLVPSHLLMTDMSHVKQETSLFKGLLFHIVNCHPENTRDDLHKLIVENGGVLSMNMSGMVTHAIAAEKKGLKYEATAKQHTIVHQSWLTHCCKERKLIPLRSRYLLNLSPATRLQMKDKVDDFGDYFFDDVEEDDLKQLYMNMCSDELTVGMDELDHYREKYCSISTSSQFLNCFGWFLSPFQSINADLKDIAQITLRSLQLDFIMHKGQIAKCLEDASHVVAYCEVQNQDPWEIIWRRGEFVDSDEDNKAPLEAYKSWKEKVEKPDSFTDVEVITPRRRLYSDMMTTEKGKAKVEDKIEYDVFKRLKKRRSSPMQNPKQQQVKDEIEVDLKSDLNITAEIEERKQKKIALVDKETKDSLEAMICDMIPVLNSSSDNVPNKEDSTKATHHKKLLPEENTVGPAPKKTRVSYKDLVGKFID